MPSLVNSHSSLVSFQRISTADDTPLFIDMPAFSVGVPVTSLFNVIILSATSSVAVLIVVVVPLTVKSPLTINPPTVRLLVVVAPLSVTLSRVSVSV